MIGCYLTGTLPRPKGLIEVTRAYDRGRTDEKKLEKAFEQSTLEAISVQLSADFSYITDGMLKWQDFLRPFTENLYGVSVGGLARWFNNNVFYRKPVIMKDIKLEKGVIEKVTYIKLLPKNFPWKVVLPAPFTFAQLSENQFYRNKAELMFKYAQILREEIKRLADLGIKYVQLSDPALVYKPIMTSLSRDELNIVSEALKVAVEGIPIKTCLQTFFGDFSQILPEALDFPVEHLGIDLYETDFQKLKDYSFEKGVALGLVDSRSSLVEKIDELFKLANKMIDSIYCSKVKDVFICPNCDLDFLPWEIAEEKIKVIGNVARLLRGEFYE
jgi:5-methyltetrahydropteroyltriglutamate--homocysteine methyltransferase